MKIKKAVRNYLTTFCLVDCSFSCVIWLPERDFHRTFYVWDEFDINQQFRYRKPILEIDEGLKVLTERRLRQISKIIDSVHQKDEFLKIIKA